MVTDISSLHKDAQYVALGPHERYQAKQYGFSPQASRNASRYAKKINCIPLFHEKDHLSRISVVQVVGFFRESDPLFLAFLAFGEWTFCQDSH